MKLRYGCTYPSPDIAAYLRQAKQRSKAAVAAYDGAARPRNFTTARGQCVHIRAPRVKRQVGALLVQIVEGCGHVYEVLRDGWGELKDASSDAPGNGELASGAVIPNLVLPVLPVPEPSIKHETVPRTQQGGQRTSGPCAATNCKPRKHNRRHACTHEVTRTSQPQHENRTQARRRSQRLRL